jgi:hypothetical protein
MVLRFRPIHGDRNETFSKKKYTNFVSKERILPLKKAQLILKSLNNATNIDLRVSKKLKKIYNKKFTKSTY